MAARRSRSRILLEFLGSMNLAISLLLILAVGSIIGTVVEQNLSYSEYTIDYGPFWFDVLRVLGVFDVYSASWFLAILGFLIVSTAVCLVRNTPTMLRELKSWRSSVTFKSLKYSRHNRNWHADAEPGETADVLRAGLERAGYGSRVDEGENHVLVTARRGRWNRFGYIFTHAAIVIIAVGGLMDSRLGMKVAELSGAVSIETRNLRASQVPEESWLPEWNHAYRGNVQVPEGTGTHVAFINMRDGYLVQPLPFTLEVLEFRIERYPQGQPKSYESDLRVHDPKLDEPFEQTISVNKPLRHRGVSVFQSSFEDGGSHLQLTALPLDGASEAIEFTGQVNERDDFPADPDVRLEVLDFALFNVNRVTDDGEQIIRRNFGPSFDYRLRDTDGGIREYRNYQVPITRDGNEYILSGVRGGPDEDFRYLYIPTDAERSAGRFVRLLERMRDEERIAAEADAAVVGAVAGSELDTEAGRQQLADTVARLVGQFRENGFDAVWDDVEQRVPEERRQQVFQAYLRVLQSVLAGLYEDVLAEEGMDRPGDAEWDFFRDSLTAINGLSNYGSPWLLRLDGFEHRQASGLQVARAPGQNVVYFGSALLVLGLFLMFYMDHRRLWFWLRREEGGTDIIMAGRSARDTIDFAPHFDALAQKLAAGTGSTPRSRE